MFNFCSRGKHSSPDFMPEEVLTLIQAYEGSSEDGGRRALQMVALKGLSSRARTNAGEPGNTVNIGGDVGQQVNGDQTVTAPMTFNMARKMREALPMGWSSLSGPIVGRLLVTEQDAPDLSLTLETARVAGVHWVHDGALGNVDFCFGPNGFPA